MDIHKNAPLTPRGREHMVGMVVGGQTPKAAAEAVGVCPRTVRKWPRRFREEGLAGLQDLGSRPNELRQPAEELPLRLYRYNWHRPHGCIGIMPPICTIGPTRNNLSRLHT